MIALPSSTRIFLACGATDMRKGFDGLAVLVQQVLETMRFGQSSKKLSQQIEQLELTLEELEGEAASADATRSETASKAARPAPVRQLPAHLSRAERRIEPEAGHCTCPDCGGSLRPLGEDSDEMLDVAPVRCRVIRSVRPKYSCRSCEKIVQAPAPVKAVARGKRPRSRRSPTWW